MNFSVSVRLIMIHITPCKEDKKMEEKIALMEQIIANDEKIIENQKKQIEIYEKMLVIKDKQIKYLNSALTESLRLECNA